MENITVSELKRQLECLEENGMGDFELWFRDYRYPDIKFTEGTWDVDRNTKAVYLA